MANVEKEIIKKYKLELNEAEYHAFESFIGATTYTQYTNFVNQHYSALLHDGQQEKLKILTQEEHEKLYYKLIDNR